MKNRFAATFVLLFSLYSCATNNSGNNTPGSTPISDSNSSRMADTTSPAAATTGNLAGRWTLIPAMASDTATGRLPFLVFDTGKVSGNTGCNSFSGSYKSAGANMSFANDMVSTRMACPGYDETTFVKNLMRTTAYDVRNDTLVLKEDVTPLSYWHKGK